MMIFRDLLRKFDTCSILLNMINTSIYLSDWYFHVKGFNEFQKDNSY